MLVGGESRRMGRDKLLLEVGGIPLIRRVHDALAARCEDLVAVGRGAQDLPLTGVRPVPDDRPGRQGPLAGLEAGLAAARHRRVFVAAGDMPFLPAALVSYLIERLEAGDLRAVVPRSREGSHPLCAAYDRTLLSAISEALDGGVRAMREFLEGVDGVAYVEERELRRFGDPDVFLINVNSPEDLERARREAG